jgi:integrase
VEIDEKLASILQGYKARARAKSSDFVIEPEVISSREAGPKIWGQHYRANATFEILTAWLRANGVTAKKPLHELRKELGSLITKEHGIHAASQMLRHSSIQVTANHYVAKKSRTTVSVGSWLTPDDVISMPQETPTASTKTKTTPATSSSKGRA